MQAPDNGALHRMGGTVVVTRVNGEQALYRFTSAQPHAAVYYIIHSIVYMCVYIYIYIIVAEL